MMTKIPEYCYEDTVLGCFSQKYWCEKGSAGSSCCNNNPGVTPKAWKDCPLGKLHKHYKVDSDAEQAKLVKARKIGNEIIKLLYNIEPNDKANHIADLRGRLTKLIKKHL